MADRPRLAPALLPILGMHACELVDLAALVSAHGPLLVRQTGPISRSGLDQYWTAAKCRLDRWGHGLKRFGAGVTNQGTDWARAHWPVLRGVLEEILTGEILTRVWTAVVCAHDRLQGMDDAEPVVRSVFIGHLEARHRVLTLLVGAQGVEAQEALRLEYLRRRTERWTDMLVGYLAGLHNISEFAIDPARARDFAGDLHVQGTLRGGRHAWSLVQGSLRAAFRRGLSASSPNADLNARIAGGILACFPPDVFDSTGIFRSLWLAHLGQAANDVQGMIGLMLNLQNPPPGSGRRHRCGDRRRF